ncbi:MAG: DUF3332 domain-containing protein [Muribaculum sp.]|nr:DUF3332 domain-containing protein [Muribaculaceae bacterium]MCM1080690.1 DUF3332 domain-containing protein [Muribaculum sp.]
MKKHKIHIALALVLAFSVLNTSCIGSFALSKNVLSWNKSVGNKFVNELVFFVFCPLVYPITLTADVLVINSIEFWSGSNPIAQDTKVIKGNDGNYLVTTDSNGYTIKSENDGSIVRFDYDITDDSWAISTNGNEAVKFMTFVDDSHVRMLAPDGTMQPVELSEQGVIAYTHMANETGHALTLK